VMDHARLRPLRIHVLRVPLVRLSVSVPHPRKRKCRICRKKEFSIVDTWHVLKQSNRDQDFMSCASLHLSVMRRNKVDYIRNN
jgi:hypothetical protein